MFDAIANRIVQQLTQTGMVNNFATTPKKGQTASIVLNYAGALVGDGNYLYMSDPYGNRVWRISRADGSVEPYAGTEADEQVADEGTALTARLAAPAGLALDSSGNLYISDGTLNGKHGRILRVDAGSGRIETILDSLRQPSGLSFLTPQVLCFAESGANQVRCLDLASHSVRLVAGTGKAGFSGDGGPAECAELNRPSGISFGEAGALYIADTGNQRVRIVHLGREPAACKGASSGR